MFPPETAHTRPKPALDTLTNMTRRARSRFTGRETPPTTRTARLCQIQQAAGYNVGLPPRGGRLGGPMSRHTGGSNGVALGTFHNRFHGCGIPRGSGVNR